MDHPNSPNADLSLPPVPPRAVGLIVNPSKERAVADAGRLVGLLANHGIAVHYPRPDFSGTPHAPLQEAALEGSDLLVVMGGDGTLLASSRFAAPRGIPMLSVRYGGFGFLAEIEPDELDWAIDRVIEGSFRIDSRMMLSSELWRDSRVIHRSTALNDIVVTRGSLSRVVRLRAESSGGYMATYSADGAIVATPTGSTAYSLSAGGPLVHPGIDVILVTPICPHSLNSRSLVLADTETVSLQVESNDESMLTTDGQIGVRLEAGDRVVIRKAPITADLITLKESFFHRLQTRLKWSGPLST